MVRRLRKPDGDELSVAGLVVGLVLLVPGAWVLAFLPVLAAITRLGSLGTTLLSLGIVVLSIAYFPAYERLKPSSPPTPRRDLVVILFSAVVVGLWTYLFTNALVAFLVLAGLGAIVLLPNDAVRRLGDHLPMPGMGAASEPRSAARRESPSRSPTDEASAVAGAGRRRRARTVATIAGLVTVLLLTVLHFGPHCLEWTRQAEQPGMGFDCTDLVPSGAWYPSFEPYYLFSGIAIGVLTYYVALALTTRSAGTSGRTGSAAN